jgi:hypothetical protein
VSGDPKPLTIRQREVIAYLVEHPGTRQDDLAAALGSTIRGIGVVLSALLWRDDVAITSRAGEGGAESQRWTVFAVDATASAPKEPR